jgi:CRP-like cAMP-binding protein
MRKVLFIFSDLSDADVEWFAAVGESKSVPRGAVLIQQGKPITEFYIVLDGQLAVMVSSPQGNLTINTLREGEVIGELSLLDTRPPSASVVAATDANVLAVSRDKLSSKLRRDSAFAAKFYRALGVFLADRLRSTTQYLGFGNSASLRADEPAAGEMDPELLDSLAIAAKRFESLVERLKSGKAS